MDKSTNDIRYAQLLHMLGKFNSDNTIFICSDDKAPYEIDSSLYESYSDDKRLESIRQIARIDGFKWIHYNDEETIPDILARLKGQILLENKINPMFTEKDVTDINVIIGGTNTGGCLLDNSNTAAINWINLGFNVQMCLSICADYQMNGINSVEKNHKAMAKLYNFIKDNDIIDKIDIHYDVNDLRRNDDRLG